MEPSDLKIDEEGDVYRIYLLPRGSETKRYVFHTDVLDSPMGLLCLEPDTGRASPYKKDCDKWVPVIGVLGDFEPGTLEHTAFEIMDKHIKSLRVSDETAK
jgi:hypothetical protein